MTEEELLELLLTYMPETFEGWAATVCASCAFLSLIIPPPGEEAHKAWKIIHKGITIFGLGASKLRAVGHVSQIVAGLKNKGGKA